MSYDVSIGDYKTNFTWNLSQMFHEHLQDNGDTGLDAIHERTGSEVFGIIMRGLASIRALAHSRPNGTPAWKLLGDKYDPSNYWGDCTSGILWLADIAYNAELRPLARVSVS